MVDEVELAQIFRK